MSAYPDARTHASPATPGHSTPNTNSARTSGSTASAPASARSSKTSLCLSRPNSETIQKVPCSACWKIMKWKSLVNHYEICLGLPDDGMDLWACAICRGGYWYDRDAYISHQRSHNPTDGGVPKNDSPTTEYVSVFDWIVTNRQDAVQRLVSNLFKGIAGLDPLFAEGWTQFNGGVLVPHFRNFDTLGDQQKPWKTALEISRVLQTPRGRSDPDAFARLHSLMNSPLGLAAVPEVAKGPAEFPGDAIQVEHTSPSELDAASVASRTPRWDSSVAAHHTQSMQPNAFVHQLSTQQHDASRRRYEKMPLPPTPSSYPSAGLGTELDVQQHTQTQAPFSWKFNEEVSALGSDMAWTASEIQQSSSPEPQYGTPRDTHGKGACDHLSSEDNGNVSHHRPGQAPLAGHAVQDSTYMPERPSMPNFSRPVTHYTGPRFDYEQSAPTYTPPGDIPPPQNSAAAFDQGADFMEIDEIVGSYADPYQGFPLWPDMSNHMADTQPGVDANGDDLISSFDFS
nr:hypothetical protein B0A51_03689 [Rachicladosporium sp. CCFEE 5018]